MQTPFFLNDTMNIGCTYQYIIDICIANGDYREKSFKEALRKSLNTVIKEIVQNTKDEFELHVNEMSKELIRNLKEEKII